MNNKSTLQITNQGTETVDIKIDGEIGYKSYWWEEEDEKDRVLTAKELKAELKRISEIEAKRIRVYINSLGGLVNHALNMYDALVAHAAEVTTIIEGGYTASAATIIFMAGSQRKISENALFLIHKSLISPWSYSFNENDLLSLVDDVQQTDKRLKAIYEKAGIDTDTIQNLMNANNGNGRWIDASDVEQYGFATEAIDPKYLLTASYQTRLERQNLPQIPQQLFNKVNANQRQNTSIKETTKANKMANDKGLFGNLFGNMSESEAEKELKNLKGKFENLESDLTAANTVKGDLETQIKNLETEKSDLETANTNTLADKDKEITDLKTERDELKAKLAAKIEAKADKAAGRKSGDNSGNDPEILPKTKTANEKAYENNKGFFGF